LFGEDCAKVNFKSREEPHSTDHIWHSHGATGSGRSSLFKATLLPSTLLLIESSRELATLVMLITAWYMGHLLLCFLKGVLRLASSILTWDVLFFVPVLWVSPVLAPIICSLTMIVFGCITVLLQQKGAHIKIKGVDWALFISGAAVIFYSFIKDYVTFLLSEGLPINIWALARNPNFQQLISQYVPTHYSWYLFFVGELLMLIGMFHVFRCAQPKR